MSAATYTPPLSEVNQYILNRSASDILEILRNLPSPRNGERVYMSAMGIAKKLLHSRYSGKRVLDSCTGRQVDNLKIVLEELCSQGLVERALMISEEYQIIASKENCRREGYALTEKGRKST